MKKLIISVDPKWLNILQKLSLPVIILLHLYFKLFHETFLLYGDEAFTVYHAQKDIESLLHYMSQDASPVTFYLLLSGWIKLVGIGAMAVKILPVAFSIGSAVLLYFFARKRINYTASLVVSALFLFSNLHFDFSHEIRVYSMVSFLAIASYYLFFELLDRPSDKRTLILYTFTTALLPYSHYTAALIPATQLIVLFLLFAKNLLYYRNILLTYALAFLLFIPQFFHFQKIVPGDSFWLQKPDWTMLKFVSIELFGNTEWFNPLLALLILFIAAGLSPLRKWVYVPAFKPKYLMIFLMWFLLPVALNYLIAQFSPVFRLRYILFASFGILFALSYCLGMIRFNNVRWIVSAIIVGLYLSSFSPENRNIEDWENIAEIIQKEKDSKTAVVISASYKYVDFSYYFNIETFKAYDKTRDQLMAESIFPVGSLDQLQNLNLSSYEKVLLVLSHNLVEDPDGSIPGFFQNSDYQLCKKFGSNYEAKVYKFVKDSAGCDVKKKMLRTQSESIKCYQWDKKIYKAEDKMITTYILNGNASESCDKAEPFVEGKIMVGPGNTFSPTLLLPSNGISNVEVFASFDNTTYKDAKFVISLEKNIHPLNRTVNLYTIRRNEYLLQESTTENSTADFKVNFSMHIKNRYRKKDAELVIYFWNYGGEKVYMKDFRVEVINE